ncbi:hypothetical protein RHCRD62_70268 [Rhodococcus sp. RD6.2]|nr:hypothetical protein RHCRD62_70268 [Rhodococcus sp. RD6.2]
MVGGTGCAASGRARTGWTRPAVTVGVRADADASAVRRPAAPQAATGVAAAPAAAATERTPRYRASREPPASIASATALGQADRVDPAGARDPHGRLRRVPRPVAEPHRRARRLPRPDRGHPRNELAARRVGQPRGSDRRARPGTVRGWRHRGQAHGHHHRHPRPEERCRDDGVDSP